MRKKTRVRQPRKPVHKHGDYNKPIFGLVDENEAVKDYTDLKKHLKSKESKKILTHITRQERHHKFEFRKIIKLEKEG